MTRWAGRKSTSMIEEFVRNLTWSRPGMAGTTARPPTLTKMRLDVIGRRPALTDLGKEIDIHDRGIRQELDLVQTRHGRHHRPSPNVDEDAPGRDRPSADAD